MFLDIVCYGPPSYHEWTARDSQTVVESPGPVPHFVPAGQIRMTPNGLDYDFDWTSLVPMVESVLEAKHEN